MLLHYYLDDNYSWAINGGTIKVNGDCQLGYADDSEFNTAFKNSVKPVGPIRIYNKGTLVYSNE